MLEKNQFLIFNHVLSELYRCRTYQDLGDAFLPMLRMLIPYRYASIMRRAEAGPSIHLVDPLCVPAAFAEAERRYMRFAADDYTAWLSCCRALPISKFARRSRKHSSAITANGWTPR